MQERQPPPDRGARLDWTDLPRRVRSEVERWLGSEIVSAVTQPTGFSPGVAARLTTGDGRRVFAKAVGPEPNADAPAFHRREIGIAASLPDAAPSPRLLWSYDEGPLHNRHSRDERPLHNRHSREGRPSHSHSRRHTTVIPAKAGIQGWAPQPGNRRIATTAVSRNVSSTRETAGGYCSSSRTWTAAIPLSRGVPTSSTAWSRPWKSSPRR